MVLLSIDKYNYRSHARIFGMYNKDHVWVGFYRFHYMFYIYLLRSNKASNFAFYLPFLVIELLILHSHGLT